MHPTQKLIAHIQEKQSYLCVGLDTDPQLIPAHLQNHPDAVVAFNKAIIEATTPYCVAYKINTAFYESRGLQGWKDLEETLALIPDTHFSIADAKRGDIGNTSAQYAKAFFETLPFDAITVAPYMGSDSIQPFLDYADKVTIVLGLTSNRGSQDFQQLHVQEPEGTDLLIPSLLQPGRSQFLYEEVMMKVAEWGNTDNLMFVAGATQAGAFAGLRRLLPDHFLLVPGVGFQGGSLADVSSFGLNNNGGLLVNASRAIIYAGEGETFAEEAAAIAQQYHFEMKGMLSDRINWN